MEDKRYQAKNLSDAITDACAELGLTSDQLEYKILQEGTNGFFGFGAKPFIISVKVPDRKNDFVLGEKPEKEGRPQRSERKQRQGRNEERPEGGAQDREKRNEGREGRGPEKRPARTEEKQSVREEKASQGGFIKEDRGEGRPEGGQRRERRRPERDSRKEREGRGGRESSGIGERQPRRDALRQEGARSDRRDELAKKEKAEPRKYEKTGTVTGDPVKTAGDFLVDLFAKMEMKINYRGEFHEENNELIVDLSGEDMGVLIGKRGQTLDALQYLTSQVVNKHQTAYIRVKLDTENYRERRKETMEVLAQNIAQKVRRTRKPVALEPMNPYERRIIHSVLQADKEVITRSEGVEPYRHVVVVPVRKKRTPGGGLGARNAGAEAEASEEKLRENMPEVTENLRQTPAEAAENVQEEAAELTERVGGAVSESVTEMPVAEGRAQEAAAEAVAEKTAEAVDKEAAEAVTDRVVTESVMETVTESVTETVAETVEETVTETVTVSAEAVEAAEAAAERPEI